ncbi:MAG: HTH domain-containing protein [Candidatus Aenigmatarchaeota archaeon]
MEDILVKEEILQLLSKHPEGLTITSIAEKLGIHRHTATKYVKDLILSGKINERNVGMAKLCFLNKYKSKHIIGEKAETGQAQIFALAILLFFIPVLIIAQNFGTNMAGSFAEVIDTKLITSSSDTITATTIFAIVENSTETATKQGPLSVENYSENSTDFNEATSISGHQNILSFNNEANETISNNSLTEIQDEILQPTETIEKIELDLNIPKKINRGEEFQATASVLNKFSSQKNVKIKWMLPPSFSIISGSEENLCDLKPKQECLSSIRIKAEGELGTHDIKVKIRYE